MTRLPHTLHAGLLLTLLLGTLPGWAAGSIDAGKQGFADNCEVCHGTPPLLFNNAGRAANSPTTISSAISGVGQMRFLSFLTIDEMENIATYLGNPNRNDTDCTFDWAENRFAALLKPKAQSQKLADFTYRFYSASNVYVATQKGQVLFLDGNAPAAGIQELGPLSQFYTPAIAADCQ